MTDLALFTPAALTAAAADAPEPRTAEGILVPYGQPGRTNLGPKVIARGALRLLAQAPVIGLYGHDRERSASRLIAHEDRPEGLWGRLRIPDTPTGDLLLAEIRGGVRDGLSVELSDLAFDPADPNLVISARLDAVAHVPLPAYDTARVTALAAALNDPTGDPRVPETITEPTAAPALDYTQLAAALAPHLTAAAAPAGLPTGVMTGAPTSTGTGTEVDGPAALEQLCTLQAQQAQGDVSLNAALADITNSDLPLFQRAAGAIPQQLWRNSGYTRRYVPLLTARPLTSYKFGGWEFTQLPEVDDWTGDKTEVPTGGVATREIEGTAARIAGGWDIDRKYRDFGDAAFWSAFYAAQTESYARKTDAKAAAAIIAARQSVTGVDPVTGYTRPTGYGTPVAQADILRAVAFGTAYLEDTPLIEAGPDYVLMNTQDWLGLLDTTNLDLPAFLSLMNVTPGSFQRSSLVPAGEVVMGVRRAIEWYELPGAAPIRVEALDVARGGIDSAVYGYWGSLHVRPGGVISVPLAAAGA